MAEKILYNALLKEKKPYNKIAVVSTGIYSINNQKASSYSIETLQELNIDLSKHKSKILTQKIIDKCFVIFFMTEFHRKITNHYFNTKNKKMYLMRELMPNIFDIEISDPIGRKLIDYKLCCKKMMEAIPSIINFVKANYL